MCEMLPENISRSELCWKTQAWKPQVVLACSSRERTPSSFVGLKGKLQHVRVAAACQLQNQSVYCRACDGNETKSRKQKSYIRESWTRRDPSACGFFAAIYAAAAGIFRVNRKASLRSHYLLLKADPKEDNKRTNHKMVTFNSSQDPCSIPHTPQKRGETE